MKPVDRRRKLTEFPHEPPPPNIAKTGVDAAEGPW